MHALRNRSHIEAPMEKRQTRSSAQNATKNGSEDENINRDKKGVEPRLLGTKRAAFADQKNLLPQETAPNKVEDRDQVLVRGIMKASKPLPTISSSSIIAQAGTVFKQEDITQLRLDSHKHLEQAAKPRAYSAPFGDDDGECADYLSDICQYLHYLEKRQPVMEDFLKGEVNSRMRTILVDWLVQVHMRFHLLPETLHLTVLLLDRFLQTGQATKQDLQLIGVTCMFIASKYEEIFTPELSDFVYVTDNSSTKKDILRMEIKILSLLGYDIGRPHSIHFLRRLSRNSNAPAETHILAKYLCELALMDHTLCWVLPSRLAASALHLAHLLHGLNVPLIVYGQMTMDEAITSDTIALARLLLRVRQSQCKQKAVRDKYAAGKMLSVSKLNEPGQMDLLTRLASS